MFRKSISLIVATTFVCSLGVPIPKAQAHSFLGLPEPGTMVSLSPAYEPALIKGLTVHKDDPFLFDFIVDTGNSQLAGDALKNEGDRLIKYFFAALTIPDRDLWVNLSPYEKTRMVPQALGQTAMGRDLLAQDYMLKQLTASLIYPEKALGKDFWDRVYTQAREQFGTTNIPVNTFNKVWIVAEKASVYEHNQTAFIVSGHLKVMLEEDYLATEKHSPSNEGGWVRGARNGGPFPIASQIIRSIILPAIEHEVNTGKNFATLRQIFYSQILATWFKRNLKQALLSQVYADHSTVDGVNLQDPSIKEKIYQRYLEAYKKGAFNFIKEDMDPVTQKLSPRKYFSGGYDSALLTINPASKGMAEGAIAATAGKIVDFSAAVKVNSPPADDAAMLISGVSLDDLLMLYNGVRQKVFTNEDIAILEQVVLKHAVTLPAGNTSEISVDQKMVAILILRALSYGRNIITRSELVGSEPGRYTGFNDLKNRALAAGDYDVPSEVKKILPKWIITQDLVQRAALNWDDVAQKLVVNELAIWKSPTEIGLTEDFSKRKYLIDRIFGDNSSKISRILEQVIHDAAMTGTAGKYWEELDDPELVRHQDDYSLFRLLGTNHSNMRATPGTPMSRLMDKRESRKYAGTRFGQRIEQIHGRRPDQALLNGGIDLSALDSGLSVAKDANGGVTIIVDPALVERVRREGIKNATPVIVNMRILPSVDQLLGL